MSANQKQPSSRQRLLACVVAIALGGPWLAPVTAAYARVELPAVQIGISAGVSDAPGFGGRVHRMVTRTERTLGRFAGAVSHAVFLWIWLLASAVLFLFVAAVASVIDLRMLDVRHQSARDLVRDLFHGVRTFFRVLRDRHTGYLARAVLVCALFYWLLPFDFLADDVSLVSVLDDLLVTIVAAKVFIHLCPDAVVAAHADAVRAGA